MSEPCPRCSARMLAAEGSFRISCLMCGEVVFDDPTADTLGSVAWQEATRPRQEDGRHSKRIPLEKHTDGLTHIRGDHDEPWHSEVN